MMDEECAFDVALLEQQGHSSIRKKKWTLQSIVNRFTPPTRMKTWRTASMTSNTDDGDDEGGIPLCISYRSDDPTYRPPSLDDDLESPTESLSSHPLEDSENLVQTIFFDHSSPMDIAIVRERNDHIREIHGSLGYMNEIQKDLAVLVDDQQEMIQTVEDAALEALHQTAGGLSQLQRTKYSFHLGGAKDGRSRECVGLLLITTTVLIALHWLVKQSFEGKGLSPEN